MMRPRTLDEFRNRRGYFGGGFECLYGTKEGWRGNV